MLYLSYFSCFFIKWVVWNQKFGCLQHARHTPVPLHNSQSAMALLHGYPLGLFDHPKWTSQVRDEQAFDGAYRTPQSGEQVTGSRRFLNKTTRTRRLRHKGCPGVVHAMGTGPALATASRTITKYTIRRMFLIFIFF